MHQLIGERAPIEGRFGEYITDGTRLLRVTDRLMSGTLYARDCVHDDVIVEIRYPDRRRWRHIQPWF